MKKKFLYGTKLIFTLLMIVVFFRGNIFAGGVQEVFFRDENCEELIFVTVSQANDGNKAKKFSQGNSVPFYYSKDNFSTFFGISSSLLNESFDSFNKRGITNYENYGYSASVSPVITDFTFSSAEKLKNTLGINAEGTVKDAITKSNNGIYYKSLPIGRNEGYNLNATDYAIKVSRTDGGVYDDIGHRTEVAYKTIGSSYYSYNLITKSAEKNIFDYMTNPEYAREENGKKIVESYVSKVLAVCYNPSGSGIDKSKYIVNIDNKDKAYQASTKAWGTSGLYYEDLFYKMFQVQIFDSKKVKVIHKYLDENGEYVINSEQTKEETFSSDTLTISQDNKKSTEHYNYVGYKMIESDRDEDLESKVDNKAGKGYKYKEVELNKDDTKSNVLICFYYAPKVVEVNHFGIDEEGNEVKLKEKQVEYLKPGEKDKDYEYLGDTYTYNKKSYKYTGLRLYASISYKKAQEKVLEATLRTKTKKWTVVDGFNEEGKSYGYGDGEKFNTPSAHVINFYYEVDGGENDVKKIYIRHISNTGELIGSNDSELIDGVSVKNGTNTITKKTVSVPSGYSEYFVTSLTSKATLSKLSNVPDGYEYSGFKIGKANTQSEGKSNRDSATINTGATASVKKEDKVKYIFVDFIYQKDVENPPQPEEPPEPINLTGRLCFINNPLDPGSNGYSTSTISEELDYIASGKSMKGYVSKAYPFYFRRADWKINKGTKTETIKIVHKVNCTVSWFYTMGEGEHLIEISDSQTETDSKTYTYTVKAEYLYYVITNLRIYEIASVYLHDTSNNNVGGSLFDVGKQSLGTSEYYKNRLNGSIISGAYNGKFNSTQTISGNTITFEEDLNGYSASNAQQRLEYIGNARADVAKALSSKTAESLASTCGLEYEYECYNDTFSLPNMPELFVKNYLTKKKKITSTNTSVEIDSTKSGGSELKTGYITSKKDYQDSVSNATLNVLDFEDNPILRISHSKANGLRVLSGEINYKIKNYRAGGAGEYHSGTADYSQQKYEFNNSKNNVNKVNVLTPLNLSLSIKADKVVNHSNKDVVTLQKNSTFTIRPSLGTTSVAGYSNVDTNEFVKFYYIKCDFDITNLVVYGTKESNMGYVPYTKNDIIRNGTWIKVPAGGYITGKATQYTETGGTTTDRLKNNVYCVAVTKNIPPALEQHIYDNITNSNYVFSEYTDVVSTLQYTGTNLRQISYYTLKDITADAYHRVSTSIITSNLGRIFDFKLTDCSDLNFKDVFRKTNSTNVNEPSGVVYFSGIKRLKMYTADSNVGYNDTEPVANQKTILPLGPYKNTNQYKIEAPKLGYRFSYDLKTTGMLSNDDLIKGTRYVKITPSYYYISKSGTGYDENITLYYKNESGKYVPFVNSGYSIYFRPNDGYRNLSNKNITPNSSFLSTKLEKLDISNSAGFIINSKMVDTSGNNDNFIQTWYGEFKLPNSTIAVPNGGNINNPKTDGYIGVKFVVECIDKTGSSTIVISYNANDKSASGINTTQWDYDGYAGFNTPGTEATNLKLSLEKGILNLDNNMYNKIKGTVVLYDTDNRAAQDFE